MNEKIYTRDSYAGGYAAYGAQQGYAQAGYDQYGQQQYADPAAAGQVRTQPSLAAPTVSRHLTIVACVLQDPYAAAGGEAGSVWEERYSSRHSRPYWTNTQTGESTWQDPNAAAAAAPQQYGY